MNLPSKSADSKQKELVVLLLRHGERQDEAPFTASLNNTKTSRMQQPLREELDPEMTPTGYVQAIAAWSRILEALDATSLASNHPDRKRSIQCVGVVCSPMHRCVGTTLMLSAAVQQQPKHQKDDPSRRRQWEWWNPFASTETEPEPAYFSIPISIVDGLCICAAAVDRLGGMNVVHAGLLPFAANPNGNRSSHLNANFETELKHIYKEVFDNEIKSSAYSSLCPVRFIGHSPTAGSFQFLSPPLTASSITESRNKDTPKEQFNDIEINALHHLDGGIKDETFFSSLDKTVLWAVQNKLDCLIVATHREGIRSLAERSLKNMNEARTSNASYFNPFSTPYCCIGTFAATIMDASKVSWKFHKVTSYEKFSSNMIDRDDNEKFD